MKDPEVTNRCLQSVYSNSPMADVELILTDNGSSDGIKALFESQDRPNVQVIRNEKNLGFSKPHSTAFDRAQGEFFVMLNNDTVVPKDWLKTLEAPLKSPKAALSAPRGGCCTLDENMHGIAGTRIDYVEGACLMGRSEILRRHGLFSDYLYFAYGEDSDLSLRLRKLGYTIHHVDMKLEHIRGHTAKSVPNIPVIQEANHQALRPRWMHYLAAGKMDYPIIVRREGAIGDVILTTPIIKALKESHPLNPIHVETKVPDVYKNNPWIASVSTQCPVGRARIINLNMAYENYPMTHIVKSFERAAWLEEPVEKRCYLFPSDQDKQTAASRLNDTGWIAIHPGPTSWNGKNWPVERFQVVADKLMELGYKVVCVGGSATHPINCDLNLSGATTILELAAVLERCVALVTLDSSPLHIAQAMGCPMVGLFGATLPEFILTDGRAIGVMADASKAPCAGQRHKVVGKTHVDCDATCMLTISIEEVMDAIERILENPHT